MIEIALRIDDQVVQTVRYESIPHLPIPEVGDSVINPQTDGLVVTISRRIFDYSSECVRIKLDCS